MAQDRRSFMKFLAISSAGTFVATIPMVGQDLQVRETKLRKLTDKDFASDEQIRAIFDALYDCLDNGGGMDTLSQDVRKLLDERTKLPKYHVLTVEPEEPDAKG